MEWNLYAIRALASVTLFIIWPVGLAWSDTGGQFPKRSSGLYFSLGEVTFDAEKAREEGVEDSGTAVRIGWESIHKNVIWTAGMSYVLFDDNREFTQAVRDTFGRQDIESSSASSLNAYLEAGFYMPLGDAASVSLLGGYELVLDANRGIDFCSDCYEENIDLDAGLYVSPRLDVELDSDWFLGLEYTGYISGDYEDRVLFNIGFRY